MTAPAGPRIAAFRRFLSVLAFCCVCLAVLLGSVGTVQADPRPPAGDGAAGIDERRSMTGSFFTGLAIDTFSVNDLENYRNQDDSGTVRQRGIAGFDFEFRLAGDAGKDRQLWLYGETVHGVRSTDVDCERTPSISVCRDDDVADPNAAIAILRNATSLEGYLGLRYEFFRIQNDTDAPSRVYLKVEEGFVTIAGANKDAAQVNKIAVGITRTGGRYMGSYLDVGYGSSEYLFVQPNGRYKVDGLLTWTPSLRGLKGPLSPFAQLTLDVDLKDGPDSITTFIGIDFDLGLLFGK